MSITEQWNRILRLEFDEFDVVFFFLVCAVVVSVCALLHPVEYCRTRHANCIRYTEAKTTICERTESVIKVKRNKTAESNENKTKIYRVYT